MQLTLEVKDVSSGAKERPKRDKILEAARRHEIDFIIAWKLDRWGRSVVDLLTTLNELDSLGVGFISLTEALDLSTPTGRAMTGLLAVFAEFEPELMQERIKAGIAHSIKNGKPHGRPKTAALKKSQIQKLKLKSLNHSAITRKLKTSRTSVRQDGHAASLSFWSVIFRLVFQGSDSRLDFVCF